MNKKEKDRLYGFDKDIRLVSYLPTVFGSNWFAESIRFAVTYPDLINKFWAAYREVPKTAGIALIKDIWQRLQGSCTFEIFNKLVLSLWRNDAVSLHFTIMWKIAYVTLNSKATSIEINGVEIVLKEETLNANRV